VNFGTFGLALPHTAAWSIRQLPWSEVALGGIIGMILFLYLWRVEDEREPSRFWRRLIAIGILIFVLGASIFVFIPQVAFWSTGIANRVWITAAIGYAFVLVGLSGLIGNQLSRPFGRAVFAACVSAICVSGFVVNAALSKHWRAAWLLQLEVLHDIKRGLPTIPSGTTLILDGVCPYLGPAIVFESSWDLQGALRVMYRDSTLLADVVTGRLSKGPQGLSTRHYNVVRLYPYGPDLILFSRTQRTTVRLINADVARTELGSPTACPDGVPGRGTIVLPFDHWFERAGIAGLNPWL
jgi:hypothetical protein